jgi:ribose-phosphate pyrophosphokinase
LSGFSVPDDLPCNSHYLVVDANCDAGGTFIGLAKAIDEQGDATADLFVTHGIFSKNAGPRLKQYYKNVYSTDTTPVRADGVTYFNIVEGVLNYA